LKKYNFINASRKYDLKELCIKSNKYRCKWSSIETNCKSMVLFEHDLL